MYKLEKKQRTKEQAAQLGRLNGKRQRASKNKKVSAAALVEIVEKRTRVTQAAAAAVLNAAAGSEVISLQLAPKAVQAVEDTLDHVLAGK